MEKIEKITIERVFNIGNYQTIRFGMEVSTAIDGNNQQAVTAVFDRALTATETAFNDIMRERQNQQNQQISDQYDRYCREKVAEARKLTNNI